MSDVTRWSPPRPPIRGHSLAARTTRFLHTHPTRTVGWNWIIWLFAVLLVIGVVGAAAGSKKRPAAALGSAPASTASSGPPATRPASPTAARPATIRLSRRAPRTTPRAIDTAGLVTNAAGAILPDRARTPGAVNRSVTQANIHATICVSGWTSTIRPPSSYTTRLKIEQLATGYAYHHDQNTGDYEEDHLISLELGGSSTAVTNLWPEPYVSADGARVKDKIENRLHELVCTGTVSLATAQQAIASDWWTAFNEYDAGSAPAPAAPLTTQRAALPPATTARPSGATALCRDGTYSYSAHHQGACSHHGGVAIFYH